MRNLSLEGLTDSSGIGPGRYSIRGKVLVTRRGTQHPPSYLPLYMAAHTDILTLVMDIYI
jgi:hypothetical protein